MSFYVIEETALQEQELAMVKGTFRYVEPHGSKFAQDFYDKFFVMSPEVIPLFAKVDQQHLVKMIWNALVLVVHNLENPEQLQTTLLGLGRRHMNYGVTAAHYLKMGEAIMATLQDYITAESAWTEEVASSWEHAYNLVSRSMQKGAGAMPRDIHVFLPATSEPAVRNELTSPRKLTAKSSFRLDSTPRASNRSNSFPPAVTEEMHDDSEDDNISVKAFELSQPLMQASNTMNEEKALSAVGNEILGNEEDEEDESDIEYELDVQLLRDTFDKIKPNGIEFVRQFYATMFEEHPNLHTLFSRIDQSHQEKKLLNILTLIVENIENQDMLGETLQRLGEKHVGFGVIPPYFKHMGEALIKIMRKYFHDMKMTTGIDYWSPEAESSWRSAYSIVAGLLLEGYKPKSSSSSAFVGNTRSDSKKLFSENSNNSNDNTNGTDSASKSSHLRSLFTRMMSTASVGSINSPPSNVSEIAEEEKSGSIRFRGKDQRGSMSREGSKRLSTSSTSSSTNVPLNRMASLKEKMTTTEFTTPALTLSMRMEGIVSRLKDLWTTQYKQVITSFFNDIYTSFTEAPMWVIVAGTICIYLFSTRVLPHNSWISEVVESIEEVSLLIGVILYLKEAPDRRKQFHYHAWGAIDGAASAKVSQTRIMALQDLNNDGVSLRGFHGEGLDLSEVQLPGADMRQCQLNDARINDCNISCADLSYATLDHASLVKSDLVKVNLQFAHCVGTNFNGANLEYSNMFCADLTGANLSGVNLRHASLKGVCFEGAVLAGADFTGADVDVRALSKGLLSSTRMPDGTLSP